MHFAISPALGHGGYEPPRPAWKFRKRTVVQAGPAEADEPPEPAAAGSAVAPELVELDEAHFWPGTAFDHRITYGGNHPWQLPGGNPWWSRPLKLSEVGCAISHWRCWQQAAADAADAAGPALILEDDAVPADHFTARLQSILTRLWTTDPHWDLVYLGRCALDDEDRPVTDGIVRPGFSYCTFGYLLSASGLRTVLGCGFERALIPVGELLPALYMDHPREDIRSLYPKRLRAYARLPCSGSWNGYDRC